MTTTTLAPFGFNSPRTVAVPGTPRWGARAIFTGPHPQIDLLPDRQQIAGEGNPHEVALFGRWLNEVGLPNLRARSGLLSGTSRDVVVIHDAGLGMTLAASCNASHGYAYISAWVGTWVTPVAFPPAGDLAGVTVPGTGGSDGAMHIFAALGPKGLKTLATRAARRAKGMCPSCGARKPMGSVMASSPWDKTPDTLKKGVFAVYAAASSPFDTFVWVEDCRKCASRRVEAAALRARMSDAVAAAPAAHAALAAKG